jgi:hypothetical protein
MIRAHLIPKPQETFVFLAKMIKSISFIGDPLAELPSKPDRPVSQTGEHLPRADALSLSLGHFRFQLSKIAFFVFRYAQSARCIGQKLNMIVQKPRSKQQPTQHRIKVAPNSIRCMGKSLVDFLHEVSGVQTCHSNFFERLQNTPLSDEQKPVEERGSGSESWQFAFNPVLFPTSRSETHLSRDIPRSREDTNSSNYCSYECLPAPKSFDADWAPKAEPSGQYRAQQQRRNSREAGKLRFHAGNLPRRPSFVERVAA